MAGAEKLRLKVSASDYEQSMGALYNKMQDMQILLGDYKELKDDAAVKVFGEGDSNLQTLQNRVDQNIKAVQGQLALLAESRAMLQKQWDDLENLSTHVGTMFDDAAKTAKSAFNAVKIVGDLVD